MCLQTGQVTEAALWRRADGRGGQRHSDDRYTRYTVVHVDMCPAVPIAPSLYKHAVGTEGRDQ